MKLNGVPNDVVHNLVRTPTYEFRISRHILTPYTKESVHAAHFHPDLRQNYLSKTCPLGYQFHSLEEDPSRFRLCHALHGCCGSHSALYLPKVAMWRISNRLRPATRPFGLDSGSSLYPHCIFGDLRIDHWIRGKT